MTGTLTEPPTRPRGLPTSQGPAASPHSLSVRLWLCPAADGLASTELRQRFKPTRSPARQLPYAGAPVAGHAGNRSFPGPGGPSAPGGTQAAIRRRALSAQPRDPDDYRSPLSSRAGHAGIGSFSPLTSRRSCGVRFAELPIPCR